jgi:hypothetical protein
MIDFSKKADFRMNITPKIAQQMLEYNIRNRPVSKSRVEKYSREMACGKWPKNDSSPFVFDREGVLLNGQHRLMAAVAAKTTIFGALICSGQDPELFKFLDAGQMRTHGDAICIASGSSHGPKAGSICYLIGYYRNGNTNAIPRAEILGIYTEFAEQIEDMMPHVNKKWGAPLLTAILFGWIISKPKMLRMIDKLNGDASTKEGDPAVIVLKYLASNHISGSPEIRLSVTSKMLRAVQAELQGESIKILRDSTAVYEWFAAQI